MSETQVEIEERMNEFAGGILPSVRRQNLIDMALLGLTLLLGALAVASQVVGEIPVYLGEAAVLGLVAVGTSAVYMRMAARTDHVSALQSDRMLAIANESITFLREGLDERTAGEVCRIVLRKTEAAAVAITGTDAVLGFAGVGEDHHLVGGPIITRATQEALDEDEPRILHNKGDIGCPDPDCLLRAAIVVPLEMRGNPVGTLKFYYTSDRFLNETQLAMAEGLARLLSTQLELSELERQTELATQMELKALQAQINPHFLFNTINTIAAFIRTDPSEARRLLREFGAFYRHTLEQAEDMVVLERELEFVDTYVALEKARFGELLVVAEDVDDEALETLVPAFIIQPIVENSVGHGMRGDGDPLHVTISAHVAGDQLCIQVRDDGVGISADRLPHVLEPGAGSGLGIAMRNVSDRLRGYFGPESGLKIESTEGEGTCVTLTIRPLPQHLHEEPIAL
ncbi:MAG TPA: histidine kinase [Coriobacteriia bacterium]|nr:histidine kinase [Coriobacteriia bacterium]